VPVFIWAPDEEGDWPPGGASRWWLHQSLESLANDLQSRGSNLLIRVGPTLDSGLGRTAKLATPLWTLACASCGIQSGCTTA
jgi:deoxyribodipyrimidine photolyase